MCALLAENNNKPRILTFHQVADRFEMSITRVPVNGFERIVRFLAESGWRGTNLSEMHADNDIGLTFDDGWQSFYENAFPILQKHGFTATVFLISDYVGRDSAWDYKKSRHLDWHQILELAQAGIEFGSHSASHADLRALDNARLKHEIEASKKTIEDRLGRQVNFFAYPFGRFDNRVMEHVRIAGYKKAYAASNGESDFAITRTGVYLYDTPYSIYLKLAKHSRFEWCKDYVNNALAGGTIALRKLHPINKPEAY